MNEPEFLKKELEDEEEDFLDPEADDETEEGEEDFAFLEDSDGDDLDDNPTPKQLTNRVNARRALEDYFEERLRREEEDYFDELSIPLDED